MKKIITIRSKSAPQVQNSNSPRKRPPQVPGASEGGSKAGVIVAGIVFFVIIVTVLAASTSRKTYRETARSAPVKQSKPGKPPEKLWMGDWMKQHGTVSNEALRARQDRVGGYSSGRGR